MGVGGFAVLGPDPASTDDDPRGETADVERLAYPQRPPGDFLPGPASVEDMLPPLELRTAAVRGENGREAHVVIEARAEAARAAATRAEAARAAVRSQPVELSVSPPPSVGAGAFIDATLSYYYCAAGPSGRRVGDGGGFCGTMRNGQRVHSGAAACAAQYLGQRFRITGDPTGRTYTCADTGSAVHGQHRDVWFDTADAGRAWLHAVGQRAVIEIVP